MATPAEDRSQLVTSARELLSQAKSFHDEHGQPPHALYGQRVQFRGVAEMLGIARGILADGHVNDDELRALLRWMQAHPDVFCAFPGDVIGGRLLAAFEDGVVDDEEREQLHTILEALTGRAETETEDERDRPSQLFFDNPLPTIFFESWEYVLTGQFAYGPRKKVERAITDRGGRVAPRISSKSHVLLVGQFSSVAWLESTHGTKILDAIDAKQQGHTIRIIPESHWYKVVQLDE